MHTPRRPASRSQNFLVNRKLVSRLIRASSISPHDLVLDIGAGRGILTHALLPAAKHVIAVELDRSLFLRLQHTFASTPNLTLVNANFLDFPLPQAPYKVFSNIPFSITGEIVRKLLLSEHSPLEGDLIVQAEAAAKFVPQQDTHTLAAMLSYPWWDIRIVHWFCRADFHPRPNVDCVLLNLKRRRVPLVPEQENLYRDFVAYHFTTDRFAKYVPPAQWLELFARFVLHHRSGRFKAIPGAFTRLQRQQAQLSKIHRTRTDRDWKRSK